MNLRENIGMSPEEQFYYVEMDCLQLTLSVEAMRDAEMNDKTDII